MLCDCGGERVCYHPHLLASFTAASVEKAFGMPAAARKKKLEAFVALFSNACCACVAKDVGAALQRWQESPSAKGKGSRWRRALLQRFADDIEKAAHGGGGHELVQSQEGQGNDKRNVEKQARACFFKKPCKELAKVLEWVDQGLGPFGGALPVKRAHTTASKRRLEALQLATSGVLFACGVQGEQAVVTKEYFQDPNTHQLRFMAEASALVGKNLAPPEPDRKHYRVQPRAVNRYQVNLLI
jgi:hypothetical protein